MMNMHAFWHGTIRDLPRELVRERVLLAVRQSVRIELAVELILNGSRPYPARRPFKREEAIITRLVDLLPEQVLDAFAALTRARLA